jgi:uncharacterized membrane protein
MKMVPRFPERVLSALGANPYFSDDVLGDLEQEFAIRAEFDVRSARRWYYREAWRAAPYLLRSGLRNLRARDLLSLANAIVVATVAVTTFSIGFSLIVGEVISATAPPRAVLLWVMAPMFLARVITQVAGGYIAAWSCRKAPLLAAVALGLTGWMLNVAAVMVYAGDTVHAMHHIRSAVVALVFATAGGVLRVWRRRPVLS